MKPAIAAWVLIAVMCFASHTKANAQTTNFSGSPLFGCGPISSTFTDASTASVGTATITSWAWDFGDGGTSTAQNPSHVYNSPGNYTVKLTITDSEGITDTETKTNFVQVVGPNVEFRTTSPRQLDGPGAVTFQDQSFSGSPITSRLWNFGDGTTTSTNPNPTHTYTTEGTFDVSLTVNDLDGCSRTLTKTNYVNTIRGAFDVSTAIFTGNHERFLVGGQEGAPFSLTFSADGTKMFVMGHVGRDINEYTLTIPWDVSTAAYNGDAESFSVAAQESFPNSLAFSADGTKMFAMGHVGQDINEYSLTTAWDVSTAAYTGDAERFSVAAQEPLPISLAFSSDGTKMFVMGYDGQDINEYTLTIAWDVSTASYAGDAERFSVAAQEIEPTSLEFSVDGTKMFVMGSNGDDINEYNLTTAWDVSTATYAGNAERLSVVVSPASLAFSADGTQMFVLSSVARNVNEYSLAAPVVTGAVANQAVNDNATISPFATITVQDPNGDNVSATITLDDNAKGILTGAGLTGTGPYTLALTDAASLQASLRALVFNPTDGRVAFGNTETTTFSLTVSDANFNDTDNITSVVSTSVIPFATSIEVSGNPVSTANTVDFILSFNGAVTGVDLSDFTLDNSVGVSANLASISGSGTTYTVTVDNITGHGILSIDLKDSGTGITSGGTAISGGFINGDYHEVGDAFDVSKAIFAGNEDRFSIGAQEVSPYSLAFSADGIKMFVMGTNGDDVNEYNLTIAWDVSTASCAGNGERFSVAAQETTAISLAFSSDGTKMFVMGISGDDINEYNLTNAWDVSTATYAGDAERFSVAAQEASPRSFSFNTDGTKMFLLGTDGDDINEYNLSTAFDVSTAVFAGNGERFSVLAQMNYPISLDFSASGTKMFVLGLQSKEINEYNLTTAWDVSTATYAGDTERFSVAGQESAPYSLAFSNDGTKVFVLGQSGNREVSEYSLAAPVITEALANQAVNDNATISPFGAITVADPNGDNISATITLDDNAKGVLTGTGLTGTGPYTLASTSAASLQAVLRALIFTPSEGRVALGNTETTTFTLTVFDEHLADTDDITSVVASPVAPTIVWSSLASSPTNAFTITATFSEPVTGFTIDDLTVGNGAASNFVVTSSSVYTATITPTADGTVSVDAAANVAQDAGGVDNIAANQFSITADVTVPIITITSPVTDPTNGPFTATFTFSEDVTGFDVTDITVGNGTAGSFAVTSALIYTAEITPTTDGTVTVDVAANVSQDAATNGNTAATQFSVEADFTNPIVTITSSVADPTNEAFIATFTFSEAVTGFDVADIIVGNGTAGSFAVTSASVYTAEITPTTDGTVTVEVAANVAEDTATNGNQAAAQFSIQYDGTFPSVVITSPESTATNSSPFPVTITFSEEVTGFAVGDVAVGNGSAANFSTSDNIVFTADIIPASDGNITVDIASATAQDLAGSDNTAATTFSITYDSQVDQVVCQNITLQLDANGTATIQVDQIDNGSSDSFGITSRSIDITSFNCSHVGDNNVTLTITDNNGNIGTCVAIVTVEDTIAPTVITQDITVALDVNGQASITPADIDNGSTDNCGIATLTLDISSFDTPTTETATVTLTIADVNGNSAAATAIVTFGKVDQSIVFDPIPDKKAGQDPVVLQATGGGSGLPVTFSIVTEPSSGVASLIDGTIIIEGPGSVVVTASQAGNDTFQEAEDVSQFFDILSSELFLPTLFTPNNDGTNDRFILRGGGNVANIEFRIFDREGNLVFSSQSDSELFQSGWDGTNEGKQQPQGAYAWVIKGTLQDGSPLLINGKDTGIIKLVR